MAGASYLIRDVATQDTALTFESTGLVALLRGNQCHKQVRNQCISAVANSPSPYLGSCELPHLLMTGSSLIRPLLGELSRYTMLGTSCKDNKTAQQSRFTRH
eukprot:GHRR01035034.1.p1 GENE.GHRR01035034.1~~GHRR01035034.1.p1  ORF type:complete len:102 (+),score=21.32 GHRR01035034.1:190-495(+)